MDRFVIVARSDAGDQEISWKSLAEIVHQYGVREDDLRRELEAEARGAGRVGEA